MEIFKNHLDVVLGSLLWVALLEQGLEQVVCRGPCQLQPSRDAESLGGGRGRSSLGQGQALAGAAVAAPGGSQPGCSPGARGRRCPLRAASGRWSETKLLEPQAEDSGNSNFRQSQPDLLYGRIGRNGDH